MTKRSGSKTPALRIIPNFRSEAEEAAWWDANEDYIVERLKKHGRVVGPLKVKETPTRAISIRIPVEDIERAQAIAEQKGVGYQTVLKDAIRKGLRTTRG
jgi:predicted DNA binding CopG/RHH family protein